MKKPDIEVSETSVRKYHRLGHSHEHRSVNFSPLPDSGPLAFLLAEEPHHRGPEVQTMID